MSPQPSRDRPGHKLRLAGIEQTSPARAEADHRAFAASLQSTLRGGRINTSALHAQRPMVIPVYEDSGGRSFLFGETGRDPVPMRYARGAGVGDGGGFFALPNTVPDGESGDTARQPSTGRSDHHGSGERNAGSTSSDDSPGTGDRMPGAVGLAEVGMPERVARAAIQKTGADAAIAIASSGSLGSVLSSVANIGNLAGAGFEQLQSMAMGALMGNLFGEVSDGDSLGTQLAAKYGPQMLQAGGPAAIGALRSALTGSGSPDALDTLTAMLTPTPSAASIPFAINTSIPGGSGGVVGVNGSAVMRRGDIAVAMPDFQDIGEVIDGNATIFVNGAPAAGNIHKILGKKGSSGTPKDFSSNVLMGAGGGGSGGGTGGGSGESGSGGGPSGSPGSDGAAGSRACRPCELDKPPGAEPISGSLFDQVISALGLGEVEQKLAADGSTYENVSLLGGLIDLGSPQLPGAGAGGTWWIPDRIGPFDMSDYYLFHDCHFSFSRLPSDFGDFLAVEFDSFAAGLSKPEHYLNPLHWGMQAIYSGATLTVGLGAIATNSVLYPFEQMLGEDLWDTTDSNPREYDRECTIGHRN